MPVSELVGRVRIQSTRASERIAFLANHLGSSDLPRSAITLPLSRTDWHDALLLHRRSARPRFFAGVEDAIVTRQLFADQYAPELSLARTWADRALRHEFQFFGETFKYGATVPWNEDPVSRRPWPRRFHQDIKVHGGDVGFGDVKYVWELNRHQFVQDLGKMYFLTGNEVYAAEVRKLVVDWLDDNPYGIGVNWSSPLEPAYRALAWLWAYWFTIDDPALDPPTHSRWLSGFRDAARFLHRHLELYASPYNHLLGEAAVLYALGTAFPEFREARHWRLTARRILIDRLPHQFYADGGTVEQATCYHHASLAFYLLAALLGRANGDDYPDTVWRSIERGIDHSVALTQPDGTVPALGDTDDARPFQVERRPLWDYRAFAALGAVLFARGDFKTASGRFHEEALWLLGPPGLTAFERLPARDRADSIALRASGYAIMRDRSARAGDYICFDCGEQAGGLRTDDVPSAAHGHADCLSIVVWLGGRPILVDPGFFTYNSNREWERYFRETAAHNTARVDGTDQAVHLEKMAWMRVPRASLELWRVDATGVVARGSHDGYAHQRDGIIHRRTVWLRTAGYVLIHDEFSGSGSHDVEVNFQFAPGEAVLSGCEVTRAGEFQLHGFADQAIEATLACGGATPGDGWIAPGLGRRMPAPRASFRLKCTVSRLSMLTVVTDLARVRCTVVPESPLTALVVGDDFTDVIAAAGSGVLAGASAVTSEPRLGICRIRSGAVVHSEIDEGGSLGADVQRLARLATMTVDA